jgi:hypothetical protein
MRRALLPGRVQREKKERGEVVRVRRERERELREMNGEREGVSDRWDGY